MASIDKRPSGEYRARWREYPGGPQRTKQFARKVDAEQHLVKTQHSILSGAYIDPTKSRTSVEEFYRVWSHRQPWRITTRTAVATTFETHVLPTFGKRPLGSLRRGDLEAWAAKLPLAAGSVRLAMQHMGTMLAAAAADGLIAVNPADQVKRPRSAGHPVVPLTAGEIVRLRDAAPPWFAVTLTLGAGCGLRLSEATGLTVDRVDFLRRELTVDRQMLPIGDLEFGPTKTERSYRKVPLANTVVAELARHVEVHGTGRDGLLLHHGGEPMRRQRFGDVWRATLGVGLDCRPPGTTTPGIRWTTGLCALLAWLCWWTRCRRCGCPHNPGGRCHRASESSQPIREVSEVQSGRMSGVSGS